MQAGVHRSPDFDTEQVLLVPRSHRCLAHHSLLVLSRLVILEGAWADHELSEEGLAPGEVAGEVLGAVHLEDEVVLLLLPQQRAQQGVLP